MNKPNVLLLMCDQFRGDCLSFLDHPDVKTPYLDTLASDGVTFKNAYTATPSCIPARACLLTGMSQEKNGRVGYEEGLTFDYDHYLAGELTKNHYQTACIGKMHVHPPRLACGFETLKLHDGYIGHYRRANLPYWMHQNVADDYMRYLKDKLGKDAAVNAAGSENNSWVTSVWPYADETHPTNWVANETINFLETRDRTRPFFIMASFVRPHPPFDAPRQYLDMYINKDLHAPIASDWMDTETIKKTGKIMDNPNGCNDPQLVHDAMAGYYAAITHVDHQIGRIITALENDGTYNDTIIIFTSDHGELLFDHNLFRKTLPYQGSVNVPLIVRVGKNIQKITPHIADDIVELRDIMPTILDMTNTAIPDSCDGISLKKQILDSEPINRCYLHGEHAANYAQSNQWILTKNYKYIWYTQSGIEQFFDMLNDPKETHDLINDPKYQKEIDEHRNIMIKVLADREEGYSDGHKLITGKKPQNYLTKVLDEEVLHRYKMH